MGDTAPPTAPAAPVAPVGAGRGVVVDAANVDLVLRARALRRRLRLAGRVLRAFLVVALIAWLGVVFLTPGFQGFSCRSVQSEAKGNLKALYIAEEAYRAEFDSFGDDFARLGFAPQGHRLRYRYVVTDVARSTFTGWAFRVDGTDDVWRIDEHNELQLLVDGCAR